jgi:hypothetical protein
MCWPRRQGFSGGITRRTGTYSGALEEVFAFGVLATMMKHTNSGVQFDRRSKAAYNKQK